jgi:hypothetical protein
MATSLPSPLQKEIQQGKALTPVPETPYMHAAKQAIEYVRAKCGILAANRQADRLEWERKNSRDIDDALDEAAYEALINVPKTIVGGMMGGEVTDPKDTVAAQAEMARKFGTGNCEMQASLAFEFLKSFKKFPVDIVYFQMFEKNAQKPVKKLLGGTEMARPDHVFVVIGRPKATDISNSDTWGPDAVVCDPWARRAYRAQNLGFEIEALGTIAAGQTKLGLRLRFDP